MAVQTRSPEGLLYVGTFGGEEVTDRGYHRLVVQFPTRDGKIVRRGLEYAAFDRYSGEPTNVGAALGQLNVGDMIAVEVWADSRIYVDKATGEQKSMVTFQATSITKL